MYPNCKARREYKLKIEGWEIKRNRKEKGERRKEKRGKRKVERERGERKEKRVDPARDTLHI